MNKKYLWPLVGLVFIILLWFLWSRFFSPTKVAFVHYQVINLGQISKSNTNPFIKVKDVGTDEIDRLAGYDMVVVDAMGLRITEQQRESLWKVARKVPVLSITATNPVNDIVSVDSTQADVLRSYLYAGGRKNYHSMLEYVRKYIDKKKIYIEEPSEPIDAPDNIIYHPDLENADNEDLGFDSVAEYNAFLKKNNLWKEDAPHIVITGSMGNPTDVIKELENTGNLVYPVRSLQKAIMENRLDSIAPSLVINMAHGRLGDNVVDMLVKYNSPLICPLNVNRSAESWEADKMGMSGGFLSQSISTPELDGALRPFVLFGHRIDKEGLPEVYAIPERLDVFVKNINNYLSLKRKKNSEKKIAIYYFKGPGLNNMVAGGMEVGPSLFNLLKRLKSEGYRVDGLPASSKELEKMIQRQGAIFGGYAEGAITEYIKNGNPELIAKEDYESWVAKSLRPEKYSEVVAANGDFPGQYMSTEDGKLAVARVRLGNIVLIPQPAAGGGKNSFKMVHGTDAAPPHPYIAAYLWARYGFGADAIIHLGTHGSLEFTPRKQVALSSLDWPDRLVGELPHFYIYTIGNVGEGVIAKRRSYAGLQSYLTPPFMESGVSNVYKPVLDKVKVYNDLNKDIEEGRPGNKNIDEAALSRASLAVKSVAVSMGIHRELGLDSVKIIPYSAAEINRIENFVEEMATENVIGKIYTMGEPYEPDRIISSVYAMSAEPIAYSMFALDKMRKKADETVAKHSSVFNVRYLNPAKKIVGRLISNPDLATDDFICNIAGISKEDLEKAHKVEKMKNAPAGIMAMMMGGGGKMPAEMLKYFKGNKSSMGVMPPGAKKPSMAAMRAMAAMGLKHPGSHKPSSGMSTSGQQGGDKSLAGGMPANTGSPDEEFDKEEIKYAMAILEIERTVKNVGRYKDALKTSPEQELKSLANALAGGYTKPSPGGDPIANPNTIPTGRNLYSINAEATPSESAWERGKRLADNTIETYRLRHNDSIPRKVSYTLWSSEFIETEGATIAQVLYMLGVEPVRDSFGRVTDLKLIPSKELGRSRIDVVVQTSGQLRDIAASRLFLINRAVEMAAAAKDDEYENQVAEGVLQTEKTLIDKGLTPKDAREMSSFRVFGGMNGAYGTGIQGMVMSGDRWETEKEISDTYIHNMGAYYGNEKNWEVFREFAFEAALTRTDVVIQPRQSNTWGALSLDHVYEFMGGLNLAVRNVTGKDPDAYLSDYRNRNNVRMQEVKEAIGIESRTTILNPEYIREHMKGEAGSAGGFAEIIQNTYGWNVMKPKVIDKELWDDIYDVYVKDKFNLGVRKFFEKENPAALEEMTAVMLETIRKGMWKASESQIADIAELHTELVEKFKPSCSGFVCNNSKLREYVASKMDKATAEKYLGSIRKIREVAVDDGGKGVVMKKEELGQESVAQKKLLSNIVVVVVAIVALIGIVVFLRRRRAQKVS